MLLSLILPQLIHLPHPKHGGSSHLAIFAYFSPSTWRALPPVLSLSKSHVPFPPSPLKPPSPGSCSPTPQVKQSPSSSLDPYSFITTIHLKCLTFSLNCWSKYYVWPHHIYSILFFFSFIVVKYTELNIYNLNHFKCTVQWY